MMVKVLKVLKMLKVLNFWGVENSNIFTFTGAALHPHLSTPLSRRAGRGGHTLTSCPERPAHAIRHRLRRPVIGSWTQSSIALNPNR
jgi:hypothetical protein